MKTINISKIASASLLVLLSTSVYADIFTSDVRVSTTSPSYQFDDEDYTSGATLYQWSLDSSTNADGTSNYFRIYDREYTTNSSTYPFYIYAGSDNEESIVINGNGDISFSEGAVFIDKSSPRMGIGTVSPEDTLHVKASGGNLILEGDNSGTYSKWQIATITAGGFWLRDQLSATVPFRIEGNVPTNTLYLASSGNVGIGTATPAAQLDVSFAGPNTVDDGLSTLTLLSANNSEAGKASDAGFALKNAREDFQWNFRTLEYKDAFTATKDGTGGGEFLVQSPSDDFRDAIVKVAGVTVFEDGHLVTASSRELKTDIQPLDTQAALEAFDKLQPVSYAYKAHKDEAVVGFIAEDVPELVAMPSGKSIDSTEIVAVLTSVLAETRAEMEAMRAKTEAMETESATMKAAIAELKGMK